MAAPPAARPPQTLEEIKQRVPQADSVKLDRLEQRLGGPLSASLLTTPPERSPQATEHRTLLPSPALHIPVEARKESDPKVAPTDESSSADEEEENKDVRDLRPAPAAPVRKRRPKSEGGGVKRKRGPSSDVESDKNRGEKKAANDKPMTLSLSDHKDDLVAFLRQKEAELQQREDTVRRREQSLGDFADFRQRSRTTMIELLRKQVAAERQDARNRLTNESVRLGQVVYERHGTGFSEQWQDGVAFKQISQRKLRNQDLQAEIDRLKKSAKKKGSKPAEGGEGDDFAARLMVLKRDFEECEVEERRLAAQKDLHIRELKRVMDEDKSRFNNCPTLPAEAQRKPGQDFVLLTLLGKGGFSEVYKGFDLTNYREVACKIHQLNPHWNDQKKQNYLKHAIREYEIHKTLVHPKVVRLYDVFEIDPNSFCTVLEYCDGTDLDFYLKTHKTLPEKESRAIMVQIFAGLKYLNEQKRPIIHYDLKPANILFHKGEVKITDFGLSKVMEEDQSHLELTSQGAGTYWYLPPECFETNSVGSPPPRISSKVDVWSCGVMFYQMLYGRKPFGNNVSQQKILNERLITLDTLVEFSSRPAAFIKRCLTPRQDQRPDVIACVGDEYLSTKPRITKPDMPPPDPVDV